MAPPPVANENANGLLDDVYNNGGPMPDIETRAGRAAKRARLSMVLNRSLNIVTDREMGEQCSFAVAEALPVVTSMAAPAGDAATLLALNNLQKTINNIQVDIKNIQARQTNAVATESDDPIVAVTNAAGATPPVATFPATFGALLSLEDSECRNLLAFYGQPVDPEETNNRLLRRFLGR